MITLQPNSGQESVPASAQDEFGCLAGVDVCEIAAGVSFDNRSHPEFEKLTYLVNGILDYRDDGGQRHLLLGGEVQLVGAGVKYSESNASHSEPLYVVQAWLRPDDLTQTQGHYEQKYFPDDAKLEQLCLIASADGKDGSLLISQDVNVYAGLLRHQGSVVYQRRKNRRIWLQCARGQLKVNKCFLECGDAAIVDGDEDCNLRFRTPGEAEFILFDIST